MATPNLKQRPIILHPFISRSPRLTIHSLPIRLLFVMIFDTYFMFHCHNGYSKTRIASNAFCLPIDWLWTRKMNIIEKKQR